MASSFAPRTPPGSSSSTIEPGKPDSKSPEAGTSPPHPWDGYLTGSENELAFAGAQALARGQREGVSPLLVHGPSGVGKSRLLAGLVGEWLRRRPGATVAHLGAAEFASTCLEAARLAHPDAWSDLRQRFRTVELLVLEDLEDLERSALARTELDHTLDALDATGASIALSSRVPPAQWPRPVWPPRLINRLIGGLVVRIDPPSLAARRRYVLETARAWNLPLAAETVETLAEAADGFRTLDGWLARLALEQKLNPSPVTNNFTHAAGVREQTRSSPIVPAAAVEALLRAERTVPSAGSGIDAVARRVATRFGVRLRALRGPGRQAAVVEARHLAMYLARSQTGLSFAAIGAYFGGRDPATVRHACKMAAHRIASDPTLAAAIEPLHPTRR